MNCRTRSVLPSAQSSDFCINTNLSALRGIVAGIEGKSVYGYIIRTIALNNGEFHQHGCGPNWEGGLITLCTCKAYMRTYHDCTNWPGHWIAGFSGCKATPESNALVYLMLVGQAYESFTDIWMALPPEVRFAKAAHISTHGDLYEPITECMVAPNGRFIPANYKPPLPDHSHVRSWHKDIGSVYRGKRPSLVVGHPSRSYLWKQPVIELAESQLHRGCRKWSTIHAFLSDLVDNAGARRSA
jgi:hypothetical protein